MALDPSSFYNPEDWVSEAFGYGGQKGPLGTNAYNSKAPQAAGQAHQAQGFDPAMQAQTRAAQLQLLNGLQQQAAGQGPSVADQVARQQVEQAGQGASSFLAQNRGLSPGAAAYLGAQQLGQAQAQAAQQRMVGKAQEQLAAQGLLGQVAGQARNQDLNLGQLQDQNSQFNAQQFNTLLGADAANQTNLQAGQNAQIAQAELQRKKQAQQAVSGALEGGSGLANLGMKAAGIPIP